MSKEAIQLSRDEVSMIAESLMAIIDASSDVLESDSMNIAVKEDREIARHLLSRISIHLIKQHDKSKVTFFVPMAANPELN